MLNTLSNYNSNRVVQCGNASPQASKFRGSSRVPKHGLPKGAELKELGVSVK